MAFLDSAKPRRTSKTKEAEELTDIDEMWKVQRSLTLQWTAQSESCYDSVIRLKNENGKGANTA